MDAANAIRSAISELHEARGALPDDLGSRLDDLVRRADGLLEALDAGDDEDDPREPPSTAPGPGTSPAPR